MQGLEKSRDDGVDGAEDGEGAGHEEGAIDEGVVDWNSWDWYVRS